MSQDLLICSKIAILDMDKILKPLAKISQTLCAVILAIPKTFPSTKTL